MAETKKEIFISYTWSKDYTHNAIKRFHDQLEKDLKKHFDKKGIDFFVFYDKDNLHKNAEKTIIEATLKSHLD